MTDPVIQPLRAEIAAGLQAAIADPAVPLRASRGASEGPAIRMAASRIADRIGPLVAHATNTEPWYRSRVTWGAIVSALTPILAALGWQLSPEGRELVVTAIVGVAPLVGAAVTLYGRWRARTPIGA